MGELLIPENVGFRSKSLLNTKPINIQLEYVLNDFLRTESNRIIALYSTYTAKNNR